MCSSLLSPGFVLRYILDSQLERIRTISKQLRGRDGLHLLSIRGFGGQWKPSRIDASSRSSRNGCVATTGDTTTRLSTYLRY